MHSFFLPPVFMADRHVTFLSNKPSPSHSTLPLIADDVPKPRLGAEKGSRGGLERTAHSYGDFDTRRAKESYLAFADGDVPKNKVSESSSLARPDIE